MDNWHLRFAYFDHGIACEVVLIGSAQAVQVGIQLAAATVQDKFEALIKGGKAEVELMPELMLVGEVVKGNIQPFEGRFLTIK